MNWYYSTGEERQGPVGTQTLQSMVDLGQLGPNALVWNETFDGWKRLGEVDLGSGHEGVTQCAECGRSFAAGDTVVFEGRHICAECKPRFVQRVREGALTSTSMSYGGFWIRFLARVVDYLILTVVNTILLLPLGALSTIDPAAQQPPDEFFVLTCLLMLLQLAAAIGYDVGFVGAKGATPGKMLCQLKIVTADGGRVSYGRALARYFSTILSGLVLMIGYIMAAFDEEKRALHDHICSTRVIRI